MNAWLDDRGRQAIEKMGWPEWKSDDGVAERLIIAPKSPDPWSFWVSFGDRGGLYRFDLRKALALLHEHAREWLAERDVFVRPRCLDERHPTYWAIVNAVSGKSWNKGDWSFDWEGEDGFPDYDTALQAAVLATEKGERR